MNLPKNFQRTLNILCSPWFTLIWFSAMVCSYLFIDQKLAIYLHAKPFPMVQAFASLTTDIAKSKYYLIVFAGLFVLFRYGLNYEKWAYRTSYLFLCVSVSGVIALAIKCLLGRARPINLFNADMYGFYFFQIKAPMLSFPSGHATTIAALMFGLCFIIPKWWQLLLTFMLVIGSTRVLVSAHYLSDIMAGAYVGMMSAVFIAEYFSKREYPIILTSSNRQYG